MNEPADDPLAAILRFGDPRPWQRAEPVGTRDAVVARQAERMLATVHAHRARHGWGRAIAAPQIGVMRRLVCMAVDGREHVLIDPEVTWRSEAMVEVWNDCMSLPEIAVRVPRHERVSVSYRTLDGAMEAFERAPFALSELLQHEIDHLDGVLMTDRMVPQAGHASVVARQNRPSDIIPTGAFTQAEGTQ